MERICSRCHAVLAKDREVERCPACGGEVVERPEIPQAEAAGLREVDHRGIVLPKRHALGGIITPQ